MLLGAAALATVAAFVMSAGAALAQQEGPGQSLAGSAVDPRVLQEMAEAARREATQQEALRSSPDAARERAASRSAFRGLSDAAAVAAARREFGGQVFDVRTVPSRAPQGLRHESFLGPTSQVLVSDEDPDTGYVAASTAPIAVREGGELQALDLSLDRRADGFAPEQPMTPVRFGARVGDGLTFTGGGLRLVPRVANLAAVGVLEGDVVAYANADPDVDLYFSPTQTGAKFSYVVRSPQAPERLAFDLDLPAGATTKVLPNGSIAIEQEGRTMAVLQRPLALDADGQTLDVNATVADGQLVFTLAHQGKDLAYPLLVDPYWAASWNWQGADVNNPGPWQSDRYYPASAAGRFSWTTGPAMGPWGSGLYVYQCCTQYFDQYDQAYWELTAPGTSWIQQVTYSNLAHYDGGSAAGYWVTCQVAYFDTSTGRSNCGTSAGYSWTQCRADACNFPSSPSSRGNLARIGEIMAVAGYRYGFWSYVGSATVYFGDDDNPTASVTPPTGWALPMDEIAVAASDAGIGVQQISFSAVGQPDWTGAKTVTGNCSGTCDATLNASTRVGNLDGARQINVTVKDATGNQVTQTVSVTAGVFGAEEGGARSDATLDGFSLTDRDELSVDVASGNLLLRSADLSIAGTGLDLEVARSYNSHLDGQAGHVAAPGGFGIGSGSTLTAARVLDRSGASPGFVRFAPGDGSRYRFNLSGGQYTPGRGLQADLTRSGAPGSYSYVITFRGSDEKWTFDNDGMLVKMADRNGNEIVLSRQANGALDSVTDTQARVTDVQTNGDRQVTKIVDPIGREVVYSYVGGYLDTVTRPEATVTDYEHSGGALTSVTTPEGRVTKVAYGTGGRASSVMRTTDSGHTTGPTTTYAFQADGSPCATGKMRTRVEDPAGDETTYCSTVANQEYAVDRVIDPLGNEQETTYTPSGQVETYMAASNAPAGLKTENAYDANDALESVTVPTSSSGSLETSYTYTPGRKYQPDTSTDPNNEVTAYGYDSYGNPTSVADDSSPSVGVQLAYDPAHPGWLTSSTDPNGNVTTYGYDGVGNLTTITPPTVTIGDQIAPTTMTYDDVSRVATVTDGNGDTQTMVYDDLDRIVRIEYDSSADTTFSYDDDGNLLTQVVPGFTTGYDYDQLGRIVSRTNGSRTTTNAYEADGELDSITNTGGTTTYEYDDAGRLESMSEPGSDPTTTFEVNDDGARTKTTYGNGVTMERQLDAAGRVLRITSRGPANNVLQSFEYTYDGTMRSSMTRENGDVTVYVYDDRKRLWKATTHDGGPSGPVTLALEWTYDDAGNILTRKEGSTTVSYTYNENNVLVSDSTGSYNSDAAGQLLSGPGGLAFGYNDHRQTTSFTPAGGTATSWDYAGPNQLEHRTDDNATLDHTILGISRTITPTDTVDYGYDDAGTLNSQRTASTKSFYLFDGQGSITGMTRPDGTMRKSIAYDPYGRKIAVTGTATNPFEYNAGYTSNGLVHFGHRWYSPQLGRWTQPDPLHQPGDPANANAFAYSNNDPVNYNDPSGTTTFHPLLWVRDLPWARLVAHDDYAKEQASIGAAACIEDFLIGGAAGAAAAKSAKKAVSKASPGGMFASCIFSAGWEMAQGGGG